ncbi:sensor domain-containing diguanylate cyclase [Leptothrix discophora]|uniref:Diguanylate cyclase n=1 Tax=Leptothrix discophora TaxID=89 RepID=A0ABT9G6Q5_LEPDI|nr:diguanylate cyclase [Leptothrix discophora]MDP4302166.1 diguanylate cyclase [Leptothrix discophora]
MSQPSLPTRTRRLMHRLRLRASLWSGSLRLRLALSCGALIAVSVIVVTAAVLARGSAHTRQAVLDNEAASVDHLAVLLRDRVVRLQLALRAAAQPVDERVMLDREAQQRYMSQRQVLATLFSTIALVDLDGRVLVLRDGSTISHPDIRVGDRPYFHTTLQQARPVVSDPMIGRVSREAVVALTMPVLGGDGLVRAVLLGTLRLNSRDLLYGLGGADGSNQEVMQTVITDASGLVLAHPDPAYILRPIDEVPGLRVAAARWIRAGRPIEPLPEAYSDAGYVVAAAGVPGPDWMVFRIANTDALLGGVRSVVREALFYGAGVALLAMALLWVWVTRLLRPLDQLEERARALGPGGPPLEDGWPDAAGEVGELERALRVALHQRARAEACNAELLVKLRSVMSTAPIGLAFTRARAFELVSDEFCRLFGHPPGGLIGESARLIYASDEDYAGLGAKVAQSFAEGRPYSGDHHFVRRDGSRFVGELTGRPVDPHDSGAGTIWLLRDVTQERAEQRELAWSASHDALTGLLNRAHFERTLSLLVERNRQLERAGEPWPTAAVLFIDLDLFKQVNDSAGHAAGDDMLRSVARALTGSLRRDECVARLGGDEFAVLLEGCDPIAAERLAHKLLRAVEQIRLPWGERQLQVGASIGLVVLEPPLREPDALMHAADLACYAAKQSGRHAVRIAERAEPPV